MSGYKTGLLDVYRSSDRRVLFGAGGFPNRQPPPLDWDWAHDHAFDVTPGNQAGDPRWHSGHIEALLPLGDSVLVGADNGGAWLINPAFDAVPQSESFPAIPISYQWRNPFIRTFAAVPGEDPPRVVLVGCSDEPGQDYLVAVRLDPVLGGFQMAGWRPIPTPPTAAILSLVFVDATTLVVGTAGDAWWTDLDADPMAAWSPAWHLAIGINGRVRSLAQGPDRSVIAGTQYTSTPGIWRGVWSTTGLGSRQLSFTQTLVAQGRTSVASFEPDPAIAYAVTSGAGEALRGFYRSGDGGSTWEPRPLVDAGSQGEYNNCLAVHPEDADQVAVGWRSGPFVYNDATGSWERRTDEPGGHMHADVHALSWLRTRSGELRIWAGTDGGVCVSRDEGKSWDSRYNRHLRTAQVYGPLRHTLEEYGLGDTDLYERDNSSFHVSSTRPGLFGVATQDDGTLISRDAPAGHVSLWQADGGDGQSVLFVGHDLVIHTDNTSNRLRFSRLLATGVLDDAQTISVDGDPAGLPKMALGAVHQPEMRVNGRLILAFGGGSQTVYALLEPTGKDAPELVTTGMVPQVVSSVASLDGSSVLVGTADGHLYSIDVATGRVDAERLPAGSPVGTVRRLRWRGPDHALAVLANDQIFRRGPNGWEPTNGPPSPVRDVDGDRDVAGGTIFAACNDGVYASADLGRRWANRSNRLPTNPNGRAIQITKAGEDPALYYATYGWGVFRASLREAEPFQIPEIDDKFMDILFGVIQDGGGIVIVGGVPHPVDPSGPARQLAFALLIAGLAARMDRPEAARIATLAGSVITELVAIAPVK